jgi:hypothetical protein
MKRNIISTARITISIAVAAAALFAIVEPAISFGASTTSQFSISQTVTSEISFKTAPSNVVMSPSLGGISGGTSNGGTQLIVSTDNTSGYNMTITASSSLGMIGNASSTNYITAYLPAAASTSPDFNFAVNSARGSAFGYTVAASSTGDVSQMFKNTGAICNAGSGVNTTGGTNHCWLNASTSAVTIINSAVPTPGSGSTSTLMFQVTINANPNPVIPNDTYVATTTLTATTNP